MLFAGHSPYLWTGYLQVSQTAILLNGRSLRVRSPIMKKINYLRETNRVPLDLKSTINLPKTDFPMKANLPQNEPKALARWQEMGIYERIREARAGAKQSMCCNDGPPYASGPIHLGPPR